jgi:peptidoglycan/LPS O-acetylase OafA/YrhL
MEPLIIAAISLFASVVTASLSYWFTKKNQMRLEERRLKEEYYKAFIKALSDVAIDNRDTAAQKRLSEVSIHLL